MKKTLLSPSSNGSNSFQKFFALVLLIIGGAFSSNAQVATNYTYSETSGSTYSDLTTGTVLTSGAVTCSGVFTGVASFVTYTLPFPFYFNNTSYTTVNMSDNGFITLGALGNATPGSGTTVTPISAISTNANAISCYGAALVGVQASAEVKYDVLGTAPNRVFVVQYKDLQRKPALTAAYAGLLNMQIRLYETTGVIEFLYKDQFSSTNTLVVGGQVGLRGASNTDFNNRKTPLTLVWPSTLTGAANTDVLNTQGTAVGGIAQGNLAGTKLTWTPCFSPTGVTAAMQADNSTLDINFTLPLVMPAGNISWEVRADTSNPGSGSPFASGTTSSSTVSVPGLSLGTTYYIYYKSSCRSSWSPSNVFPSTLSVTPTCLAATIPYTQNFETTTVPGIPACNSVQMVAGAAMVTVNNTTPFYGFNNKNLITSGNLAQNTWYFTQKINFPAAGSYRLSYKYGGSREQAFFTQKMKVYYGATASDVGMTTLLADHNQIKLSPLNNVINFTVSTPGVYYIGFNGYAAASQGYLQLDDIVVDYTTCFPPTSLASGQVTSSSAVIAWAPPATAPAGGFEYYVSTSPTPPNSTVTISGSTAAGVSIKTLTGLNPLTTYYFWVRSSCGGGDVSEWSVSGTFTTTVQLVYCSPSGATFPQDPNGITNVTMGSINNTTGIENNNYGDYSNLTTNVAQLQTINVSITLQTGFTYDTNIWVDWNNDADFADTGELVYQGATATGAIPSVLAATFVVPMLNSVGGSTLGAHRLRIGSIDFGPFTDPCRLGNYQAFEDYTIYVTVPPPALTLDSDSNSICSGDSTPPVTITSNTNDFQVYTWTPTAGVTGDIASGFIFNPTTTTTYILTATQTSGNFSSNSATYTITVNPLPTPIAITPSAITTCQNATTGTQLTATGGIVSGVLTTVFHEGFNGATNTFTTTTTSFGATPADGDWILRPSPYLYNGFTNFVSNDSSQFYLSNSDDQGPGGTTNTELISPVFSLAGFVDASLSFWHYYRGYFAGTATVEISTNGGVSYTVLPNSTFTTVSQGSSNNFVNKIINLSAYVGQSNLRIKFKYANATFAWYWAIDNVDVSGSNTPAVYWSPTAGLYNNAALTVPYTGAIQSTVYARPNVTTVYSASADTPEGCSIYTDVTVTVTPINGGTTSGNQTLSCSSSATDITLSGIVGTVSMWQTSSSPTFASGVVNIANTTTTLTALEIGSLTSTRYYRAVITNGSCTAYSTICSIIVTKTAWVSPGVWTNGVPTSSSAVEFQFAWPAGSGNVSACSVLVSNLANVSFGPGETLTVQGEVVVNGGCTLNFANTASLYQVLDVVNAPNSYNGNGGVVSTSTGNQGKINYTRTTPGIRYLDYTYWSSPVFNTQTLTGFSPLSPYLGFYHWNNITQAWNWIDPINVMAPAKGYIIRAPETWSPTVPAPWTGTFNGTPNSGTITTPILGSGTGQVNLIGNPYPSTLDANLFLTDAGNAAVTTGTMYFWTHNTDMINGNYTGADYAMYNLLGPTAASSAGAGALPSRYVSSGTAFFMYGTAAGNATFKNSMRVGTNNNVFFKSNGNQAQSPDASDLERHRYWIDLKNNEGAFKEVLVGYIETATMGVDRFFDGDMVDGGNAVTLYTKVDDKKLSIQGRTLPFDASDLVPLSYTSTVAGNFTISMRAYDGLFAEQHVYLEDTVLNVIHDLTLSDYVFATEAGAFESRFVLRYTDSTLGTANPNFDESSIVVYRNVAGLHINTGVENMATVAIYDIRGREIATQKGIGTTQTTFANLPEAHQVLLVKITGENGKTVTKKVVY